MRNGNMIKMISMILAIAVLSTCGLLMTSCDSNSNQSVSSEPEEIELDCFNFKEYFAFDADSDFTYNKDRIFDMTLYYGVAEVEVDVYACVPLNAYNVSVTLGLEANNLAWDEQTITLALNSNGSSSKKIKMTSNTMPGISLLEADDIRIRIISVEGSIKLK